MGYNKFQNIKPLQTNGNTAETDTFTIIDYRSFDVCIDPGHGDNHRTISIFDPGAVDSSKTFKEKDFALKISKRVYSWLAHFGTSVFLTREDDIDVGSQEAINWRFTIANLRESKLLVSIHLNSGNKNAFFSLYQPNTANSEQSKILASTIMEHLENTGKGDEKDVKPVNKTTTSRDSLGVLKYFRGQASTLIEFGGIDSAQNRDFINRNSVQIGYWIALGIYRYLHNGNDPDVFDVLFDMHTGRTLGEVYNSVNKLN